MSGYVRSEAVLNMVFLNFSACRLMHFFELGALLSSGSPASFGIVELGIHKDLWKPSGAVGARNML